jgi:hypothetical protein
MNIQSLLYGLIQTIMRKGEIAKYNIFLFNDSGCDDDESHTAQPLFKF